VRQSMILADSIRRTTSILRLVSVDVTTIHHTTSTACTKRSPNRLHHTGFFYQSSRGSIYSALQGKSLGPYIWRTSVSPSQSGQYCLCSSMNFTAL
jgi:hypothetical protein